MENDGLIRQTTSVICRVGWINLEREIKILRFDSKRGFPTDLYARDRRDLTHDMSIGACLGRRNEEPTVPERFGHESFHWSGFNRS